MRGAGAAARVRRATGRRTAGTRAAAFFAVTFLRPGLRGAFFTEDARTDFFAAAFIFGGAFAFAFSLAFATGAAFRAADFFALAFRPVTVLAITPSPFEESLYRVYYSRFAMSYSRGRDKRDRRRAARARHDPHRRQTACRGIDPKSGDVIAVLIRGI